MIIEGEWRETSLAFIDFIKINYNEDPYDYLKCMYNLYKNGRYKPLSFWSIQKLLKNAIALNRGIVRLAYFSDTPKPIAGPSNCEKCNDKFIKMFDEYRETLDPKVLFEEIQCECKKYIIR